MTAHSDDFHAALQVLVGTGAVKQRLVDAYRRHLASLHEQDLPEAVRDRFIQLRKAMHEAAAAGGMTAPEASARKMSEKDAAEHATAIRGPVRSPGLPQSSLNSITSKRVVSSWRASRLIASISWR
jgi:hypothetical protein